MRSALANENSRSVRGWTFAFLAFVGMGTAAQAALVGLDTAKNYNIFVTDSARRSSTSVAGRIATGGDLDLRSVGVGSAISSGLNLEVGGRFMTDGGSVKGDIIVAGNADVKNPTFQGKLDVRGNVDHSSGGSFSGQVTTGGYFTSASNTTFSGPVRIGSYLDVSGNITANSGVDVKGFFRSGTPSISGGLRVNSNVTFASSGGSVSGGLTYGGTYSGPSYITRSQQSETAVVPASANIGLDFANLSSQLQVDSLEISDLTANGIVQRSGNTLTLSGSESDINVFSISATDLNGLSNFIISAPSGSAVIVNISGGSVTFGNHGYAFNGGSLAANASNLLFNAFEATSVVHSSLGGTLLAPNATVDFNSGTFTGTLIANRLNDGGGSFAYAAAFSGDIGGAPSTAFVPEPATLGPTILAGALCLRRNRS